MNQKKSLKLKKKSLLGYGFIASFNPAFDFPGYSSLYGCLLCFYSYTVIDTRRQKIWFRKFYTRLKIIS